MFKLQHYKTNPSSSSIFRQSEGGASSSRKSGGGRKTGVMGKGKSHHRGARTEDPGDHGILSMDPDGPYRTHLLFPARNQDRDIGTDSRRSGGSPSFMKQLISGAWGRKSTPATVPPPLQPQVPPPHLMPPHPLRIHHPRSPESLGDFYFRNKQVSFMTGNQRLPPGAPQLPDKKNSYALERPERRPNSYHCEPVSRIPGFGGSYSTAASSSSSSGMGGSFREKRNPYRSCDAYANGGPSFPAPSLQIRPDSQPRPPIRLQKIRPTTLPRMNGSPQSPCSPRGGAPPHLLAPSYPGIHEGNYGDNHSSPIDGQRHRDDRKKADKREVHHKSLNTVSKDCFIIPQNNLERFLPDGITLPREPARSPLLNILEVEDPKLGIAFHLMPPLTSLNPHLDSPLAAPTELQKKLATDELFSARDMNICSEGLLLKNLEKNSDYPYINYYVIQKTREEVLDFYRKSRSRMFETFNPNKLGYTCDHSFEIFDEVATIARPPVHHQSKKPVNDLTGYIVCIYRVFKGDDGEKFERNWLYWTGARMLYKNLPKAAGLRRITLHKSVTCPQEVVYVLLVECTHFLDHIGEAANLLPILRGRICGYTGIFRTIESF